MGLFNGAAGDTEAARLRAKALQYVYAYTGSGTEWMLNDLLKSEEGDIPPADFFIPSAQVFPVDQAIVTGIVALTTLKFAWTFTPTSLLVFIAGVELTAQGEQIWASYTGAPDVFGPPSSPRFSPYYYQCALYILRQLGSARADNQNAYICGHSAGGCVASHLANAIKAITPGTNVQTISFGAPSRGAESGFGPWREINLVSWMNSDDPVPLIPPRPTTYERVMAGLTSVQGQRLATFGPNPNGWNISLIGHVFPSQTPANVIQPPTQAIANWLAENDAGNHTSHSIEVYVARLLAVNASTPPIPPDTTSSGGGGDESPTYVPGEIQAAADRTATAIYDQARAQTIITSGGAPVVPDDRRFHVRRQGRVYWVYKGTTPIVAAPTRRRAHKMARLWNNALEQLQTDAFVDVQALKDVIASYLEDASHAGNGFVPAIAAVIPNP